MRAGIAGAIAAVLAAQAGAEPFSTRAGTSGALDVADASALDLGGVALGVELRLDRAPGKPDALGPSPLSAGLGLGSGLEAGVALREGGLPGDPRPSPLLFAAALKERFLEQAGALPAMGLQLSLDRINWKAHGALDLLVTADLAKGVRASALIGAEQIDGLSFRALGTRAGGTLAWSGPFGAGLAVEALRAPGGTLLGGALRWSIRGESGIALGAQWQPGDSGLRVSLGFSFSSAPPRRLRVPLEEAPPVEAPTPGQLPRPEVAAPKAPVFRDPVPRLRLKVKGQRMPGEDASRHLQYGPADGAAPKASPGAPAGAPPREGGAAGSKVDGDEAGR